MLKSLQVPSGRPTSITTSDLFGKKTCLEGLKELLERKTTSWDIIWYGVLHERLIGEGGRDFEFREVGKELCPMILLRITSG